MEYNRNTGGIMDEGIVMSLLEMRDHSITLYLVIMCYGWADDGAFDYPNPEAASRVMMYSLRKL